MCVPRIPTGPQEHAHEQTAGTYYTYTQQYPHPTTSVNVRIIWLSIPITKRTLHLRTHGCLVNSGRVPNWHYHTKESPTCILTRVCTRYISKHARLKHRTELPKMSCDDISDLDLSSRLVYVVSKKTNKTRSYWVFSHPAAMARWRAMLPAAIVFCNLALAGEVGTWRDAADKCDSMPACLPMRYTIHYVRIRAEFNAKKMFVPGQGSVKQIIWVTDPFRRVKVIIWP